MVGNVWANYGGMVISMSDKVRELINRVLEWVWAHPGTHFRVCCLWTDPEGYFELYRMEETGHIWCAEVGGNKCWSLFRPCTEKNLETLLGILAEYDRSNEAQSLGGSNEV